jgi:hypothetical protein
MEADLLLPDKLNLSEEQISWIAGELTKIVTNLQYSEYELILFMESKSIWQGPKPQPPVGFTSGAGNIDFGTYLYWLNSTDPPENITAVIIVFLSLLLFFKVHLPTSLFNTANYNTLSATTLIYDDGSVLSTSPYCLYDPMWFYAIANLGITLAYYGNYNASVFPVPKTPPVPIKLTDASTSVLNLGMLSDWGAGTANAANVITGLAHVNPDYIIHLGDIYYAGSPGSQSKYAEYYNLNEVQDNFLSLWPSSSYSGKSFTLNGNHEMYSGGNGYFPEVLAVPGPFSAQNGFSYCAMQVGDWTIVCLDSAYFSDLETLYSYGDIGGTQGIQAAWVKSLNLDPKKVIVMTHHNGFDPACSSQPQGYYQPYWDEIHYALGDDPYAWYWGHMHNAIVYDSPVTIGSSFKTSTLCRCIGNGSLPYGYTDALNKNSNIRWCTQNAYRADTGELPNGFITLSFELNNSGTVTGITETYYVVEGADSKPIFRYSLF